MRSSPSFKRTLGGAAYVQRWASYMRTKQFMALVAVGGLVVAIIGSLFSVEFLLPGGAIVFAVGCAALAGHAVLRGEWWSSSDFEQGAQENPIAPPAAEQELKRHDRGTIPR